MVDDIFDAVSELKAIEYGEKAEAIIPIGLNEVTVDGHHYKVDCYVDAKRISHDEYDINLVYHYVADNAFSFGLTDGEDNMKIFLKDFSFEVEINSLAELKETLESDGAYGILQAESDTVFEFHNMLKRLSAITEAQACLRI